jgi:hypothetical protein
MRQTIEPMCLASTPRVITIGVLIAMVGCNRKPAARRDTATRPIAGLVQQASSSTDVPRDSSPVTIGPIRSAESSACDTAVVVVRQALSLSVRRQDGSFKDSFEGDSRVGCRLTAAGSFAALGDGKGPVDRLADSFQRRHWAMDLRYQADGPDGSDVAVRQRETLCLIQGRWDGGDDSDTSSATRPPTPEEDRYDVIVECAHDVVSNENAEVPDSIWSAARAAGLDSLYAISFRVQSPPYFTGDFDGDGSPDAAVLVEARSTGKLGIAFVHYHAGRVFVVGAGNPIARGPDDLSWIDELSVLRKDVSFDTVIHDVPSSPRLGDALWVARADSASAFLLWTGQGYVWEARPVRQ